MKEPGPAAQQRLAVAENAHGLLLGLERKREISGRDRFGDLRARMARTFSISAAASRAFGNNTSIWAAMYWAGPARHGGRGRRKLHCKPDQGKAEEKGAHEQCSPGRPSWYWSAGATRRFTWNLSSGADIGEEPVHLAAQASAPDRRAGSAAVSTSAAALPVCAGRRVDAGDVARDLAGAPRGLLGVARDLLGRGTLLLDRRGDRGGDLR